MTTTRNEAQDSEIVASIPGARARVLRAQATEPTATAARYDRKTNRFHVDLLNGCAIAVKADLLPAVRDGTAAEKADVEVTPLGDGLHWGALDADYYVTFLVSALIGDTAWTRELARAAGRVKSPAKARAARANGAKGGRPRLRS